MASTRQLAKKTQNEQNQTVANSIDREKLLKPFTDQHPCGNDPLYSDTYEKIKYEIEKVSGCDYGLLSDLCQQLLLKEAKDLRVAGYLCIALTQQNQLAGLERGITLYQNLLETFSTTIHPQSHRARLAALSWLNQNRIPAMLSTIEGIDRLQRETLTLRIKKFNDVIETQLGESFQRFRCLDGWLAELPSNEKIQPSAPEVFESGPSSPSNLTEPSPLDTPEHAQQSLRKIIRYWQEEAEWLTACQLARTYKWSKLTLPGHHENLTEIPAPRKEAVHSLEKLTQTGNPHDIMMQCESIFLEPGGHFFLDLQYYTVQAALKMRKEPLSDFLQRSIQWLLNNYPELITLTFSNGQPFANPQTQHWIQTLLTPENKPSTTELNASALVEEVLSQSNTQTLPAILKNISAYATQNQLDQFIIVQAKAQACQTVHRDDLALALYQQLFNEMRQKHFFVWFPKQATQLLKEMLAFVHRCGKTILQEPAKKDLLQALQGELLELNETV